MNEQFDGRTVLVTGAAGALGRHVANSFAQSGAGLILVDVAPADLQTAFPEANDATQLVAVDLLDGDATGSAVVAAERKAGGIDAVCAIAGGFDMGFAVHETPAEQWKRMDDLNVQTLLNTLRAVAPGMIARGRGKIVTVGANAAHKGLPEMAAYCASKSAVMRITESMSGELRARGINVNCVLPSILDTAANREAMPDADPADWVAPEKLANVIKFLASDDASAVHGALIPVVGLS